MFLIPVWVSCFGLLKPPPHTSVVAISSLVVPAILSKRLNKFFCPHIVLVDARALEQCGHRSDHSRRACDVVDRSIEPESVTGEHLAIDVPFFVGLGQRFMASDRWHEGEIKILRSHALKLFDESGFVRLPV